MHQDGMSGSEIANDLGISRQAVSKQIQKSKEEGIIKQNS